MKLRDRGDASIVYVDKFPKSIEIGGIVVLFAEVQPEYFNQINAKLIEIDGENYKGEIIVHTIDPDIFPTDQELIKFKENNIIIYK